jgi:hypothetical protein
MFTYYSSFAFLLVSLWANGSWIQPYCSVLCATSVLHHAKFYDDYAGRKWVQFADRCVAHVVGLRAMYESMTTPITDQNKVTLIACQTCFAYVATIYYGRLRWRDDWYLHKTIHVVGSLGLWLLYQSVHHDSIDELCKPRCDRLFLEKLNIVV